MKRVSVSQAIAGGMSRTETVEVDEESLPKRDGLQLVTVRDVLEKMGLDPNEYIAIIGVAAIDATAVPTEPYGPGLWLIKRQP